MADSKVQAEMDALTALGLVMLTVRVLDVFQIPYWLIAIFLFPLILACLGVFLIWLGRSLQGTAEWLEAYSKRHRRPDNDVRGRGSRVQRQNRVATPPDDREGHS
jgi:hypothetical protein